ncbi:MAG: methyltransferase [Polyangiaceae bacterium]|nr:methyltransferase [Polyangiaceae bacterium]
MTTTTHPSCSLDNTPVKNTLDRLHTAATKDWRVFARAMPSVVAGYLRGRTAEQSVIPWLKDAYIPVDASQGRVLYQLARASGARRIVEFGTSFGISLIYLAAAVRDNGGGLVTGTELEPHKRSAALANAQAAGVGDCVEVLEGDARETLAGVEGPIDLLLLDGWKDACLPVLKLLQPKLRKSAMVLCDDVKPFRKTLAGYVDYVRAPGNGFVSFELPLGDGLEFSVLVG